MNNLVSLKPQGVWIVTLLAMLALAGCGTDSSDPADPVMCTMEAKICPDGSYVGRNPALDCAFNPCPELVDCGPEQPCPDKYTCLDFQGDELGPYCFLGENPCILCPSGQCDILETFPPQVVCR